MEVKANPYIYEPRITTIVDTPIFELDVDSIGTAVRQLGENWSSLTQEQKKTLREAVEDVVINSFKDFVGVEG